MNSTKILCSATVAATVLLGAVSAMGVSSQRAFAQAQPPPASGAPAGPGRMGPAQMGQMMAERKRMQAEMAAQETRLDELVAQMNAATGTEKIERVAAALTELVAQHKAMHRRMMGPGGMMMPSAPTGTPPSQGRGTGPVPPQAHDQHTQHQGLAEEEMCRPPV